jgi:hypothetical protein
VGTESTSDENFPKRSGLHNRFAGWLFGAAGIYGLIVLVPQFFLEQRIGTESPPAITHPEYFYGFIGVGAAWQVAFLVIACDPARLRPVILPGVLEKVGFGAASIVLFCLGRLQGMILGAGIIDLVWATLFLVAWRRLAEQ